MCNAGDAETTDDRPWSTLRNSVVPNDNDDGYNVVMLSLVIIVQSAKK